MTTRAEEFFAAMLEALPAGWRIVDGPHENIRGKSVVYVAREDTQALRVRVQAADA